MFKHQIAFLQVFFVFLAGRIEFRVFDPSYEQSEVISEL